ncbi:thiol:disulfide interchange protein (fragment) [Bartonella clarridgeiae 73]|uniref:Thiol:disulfide interchange protein n=1 Tax=Bartonella clarridgeiae (strain CCUG 45776 / CIP 104772 / 73) TaxID=696125 RepID=E6YG17_BARC7
MINFWGSWCLPCRAEHPILIEIAKDKRFDLIGINYKDNQDNAQRFLNNFGNPFKLIGFDALGLTAINWGIYGPPETFILNKDSIIIGKHTGPLTWQIYQKEILPKIEKAIITDYIHVKSNLTITTHNT